MKIQKIVFKDTGPLSSKSLDFTDSWTGEVADKVLFSGPNGTGKSIILRAIAMLWSAAGYWLDTGKPLPQGNQARAWLQKWGGIAIILQDMPFATRPDELIGLVYGEASWFDDQKRSCPQVNWLGECQADTGMRGRPKHDLHIPRERWVDEWSRAYKTLITSFSDSETPNIIYLDAEQRRWVTPKKHVGETASEDPKQRWLVAYQATEVWKGQLEASLIALKTAQLKKYHAVIRDLNRFLQGKKIEPDIRRGENRLRVRIENSGKRWHFLDDLSAGEHQVLILIYLLIRWLQPGGVVLIDEPDLYLHPSLVSGLLSELERIASENHGQLIITSHNPDVWDRYDARDLRVQLGSDL